MLLAVTLFAGFVKGAVGFAMPMILVSAFAVFLPQHLALAGLIAALRADHWLHKYGDPLGKEAEPVRKAMRRQFYPETDDWKEAVLFRGHQVVRQAIAGLQRAPL